jgi:hypothetical protein
MHGHITARVALAVALTGLALPATSASASGAPVRIVYDSGRSGFDWGDAGIGAAAGAGLTLLGLGGALALTQRHTNPAADPPRPAANPGPPRSSAPTQNRTEGP